MLYLAEETKIFSIFFHAWNSPQVIFLSVVNLFHWLILQVSVVQTVTFCSSIPISQFGVSGSTLHVMDLSMLSPRGRTPGICGAFDFSEEFLVKIPTVGSQNLVKSDQISPRVPSIYTENE